MRLIEERRPMAEEVWRRARRVSWGRPDRPTMRWAVLGVALLLLAVLVVRQVNRWRGPAVTVWAAAVDLAAGNQLGPDEITPVERRQRSLEEGAVVERQDVEGALLVRPKAAGEVFVADDLTRPAPATGTGLAGSVPEGRVLMTFNVPGFPISDLAEMLRLGDRLDIFAFSGGDIGPLHMAHDAFFLGWIQPRVPEAEEDTESVGVGSSLVNAFTEAATAEIGPSGAPQPSPLLLGVRPEDVRRLVWAQNAGVPLSVILHGRSEAEAGKLLPFPLSPPAREVELILGATRSRLPLQSLQ